MKVAFCEPEELKRHIEEAAGRESFAVVDVRDLSEISTYGRIINSKHIEAIKFKTDIKAIAEELSSVSTVYIHCALSQVRGPQSAQRLVDEINSKELKGNNKVLILRGGFDMWSGLHGLNKGLTEGVNYGYK